MGARLFLSELKQDWQRLDGFLKFLTPWDNLLIVTVKAGNVQEKLCIEGDRQPVCLGRGKRDRRNRAFYVTRIISLSKGIGIIPGCVVTGRIAESF